MGEGDTICTGGRPMIVGGSNGGIVLPLGGDWEAGWPDALKAILYFLGLSWCFLGVAIIADVFMGAIEKITSKKILRQRNDRNNTTKVWNDTVANLTLMALGSSAPEILLSLIELVVLNQFHSGELGPSTIVGSAAFNLLVIIAICVSALPENEIRKVKDTKVFMVTAFFSVFAYLWLIFILMIVSPDVVEVWEALLTFIFFPLLVWLAYLADIGKFDTMGGMGQKRLVLTPDTTKEEQAEMMTNIRRKYGDGANEHMQALMEYEYGCQPSRAARRVKSTRSLVKGKRVLPEVLASTGRMAAMGLLQKKEEEENKGASSSQQAVFNFVSEKYSVLENCGKAVLQVARSGDLSKAVSCRFSTKDGTAKAWVETADPLRAAAAACDSKEAESKQKQIGDYEEVSGTLDFKPQEAVKTIEISIVQDKEHEDTEEFYVELLEASTGCQIGSIAKATVVIIDCDVVGVLSFQKETLVVQESSETQQVPVLVLREGGANGQVSCSYCAEDASAIAGPDYKLDPGRLVFEEGQMTATIEVTIMPKGRYEGDEQFRIILKEPEGGVKFNDKTDGNCEQDICTVCIKADPSTKDLVDKMASALALNWDAMNIGHTRWKEQFAEAIYCGGSAEDQHKSSWVDFGFHIACFPWKILFACVPPTDYAGGWICFCCALTMIGIVTAIIGDMANLLGCAIGLCNSTTAITLVALGTSLPDTFASKQAATQDPYADASIGNVTGSNSVNVFLGLGLPWLIGAIYWAAVGATDEWFQRAIDAGWPENIVTDYPDGAFVVPAGSLASSVAVFSACACACLATLVGRRMIVGGELGGGKGGCYATSAFFVSLWLIYIVASIIIEDGPICKN